MGVNKCRGYLLIRNIKSKFVKEIDMFTFGFSYVGLTYLLMLFIPNMIWAKNPPKGYSSKDENRILIIIERIGEALCTCCALVFKEFNIRETAWIVWLGVSFVFVLLYEIYWARYFKSEKNIEDFYKPMLGVEMPGATLPVIAFFMLGIYGTNIFMIISSIILGIGHIGIHMQHYRKLNIKKTNLVVKIMKVIMLSIFALGFSVLVFFIGARNINYFNHYYLIENGVEEGMFIDLGGQEQYVLVRGADKSNPVIVFLHGGPSSPESYVNYCWVNDIIDDYTVVDWDQRGCGRTYEHNKRIDPNNVTATYEQALSDLDELVDYTCKRFNQDKVIIIGHSYGTVLGASYIEQHPEKVSQYVAIAQVVSMDTNNRILTEEALKNASINGEDVTLLNNAYEGYIENPCVSTTMTLRTAAFPFLPKALPENSTWLALTSPYMGIEDYKWFLKQLSPLEDYLALNMQLYDSLIDFNLYDVAISKEIPVHFISGTLDYVCPMVSIEDYIHESGVNGSLYTLENCGHNVQYTKPHEVGKLILDVLSKN